MRDVIETFEAWQAEGLSVGRGVVVRTFGSAPRQEGSSLLWSSDGRLAGSVSGGCVEGATIEEIDAAREAGHDRVIRFGITDEQAWGVGLACGGTLDVLVQPIVSPAVAEAARITASSRSGGRVMVTTLPLDSPGAEAGAHPRGDGATPAVPWAIHADGHTEGSLGSAEADERLREAAAAAIATGRSRIVAVGERQYFLEAFPVRPRLVIVGAVPVAMSLVRQARELGYETIVIDGRPSFATEERFPDVDRLIVGWPDEVARDIELGPDDAVAVLSHDPKFDEPALVEALGRSCRYVGAIGSRKSQARRRERLLELGVEPAALERLHGPIGLDLGGREPAETALAIMAEIVAARYEASTTPMVEVAASRS
jgi:xanthine dehydrogenase accessory factor